MEHERDERRRTLIGLRTATVLYILLVAVAFATLKGKSLTLALIIIGGVAAKSYLHYWKEKGAD